MDPNAEPSGIEKHTVTAGEAKKTLVAGEPALPPKAITADQLPAQSDTDATGFMRRVFNAQIRLKLASKPPKPYLFDLADGEHVPITAPGIKPGLELHPKIEPIFSKMFIAITADLHDPQKGRTDVHSIGVASAYRTLNQDKHAWVEAFKTHMDASKEERKASKGGLLGEAAFHIMLDRMIDKKAPPGFSNHTRGIAVDFSTSQYFANYALDKKTGQMKSGIVMLGASSAQKPLWRKSWLYKWLLANAKNHDFKPYLKEEWHWDHAE